MSQPIVTAIIPFSQKHTPKKYLQEAKESVNQQSVPTEIIIVEDPQQRGPAWARNKGLENADTRFVAFLDADDLWKDGKLRTQLRAIRESSAGICLEGTYDDTNEFVRDLFLMKTMSLTSSILLDTKQIDIRFEEGLERREDHLFIIEAASKAGACFATDVVEIRKHQRGLSSRNTPELRIKQNKRFVEYVSDRVDQNLADEYKNELFRRLYHRIGRSEHRNGRYRSAIDYFLHSLSIGFSIKTSGALLLSGGMYVIFGDAPLEEEVQGSDTEK
jgi:glycosyltransferase involved in cell wall biosynthesis